MQPLVNTIIRPSDEYRWDIVRRGLHLARRFIYLNTAMGLFYGLWALIGMLLCVVYLGYVFAGKSDVFDRALEPFARYGLALPLGVLFVSSWLVKFYCRVLWCAVPEPLSATIFAGLAVFGRVATIYLALQFWLLRSHILDMPPRSDILVSVIFAWLGLASEWLFIRALPTLIVPTEPASVNNSDEEEEGEDSSTAEEKPKSFWNINLNDWFAKRFPRMTNVMSWIFFPILLIVSYAGRYDKSLAESVFTMSLTGLGIVQVLWTPKQEIAASLKESNAPSPEALKR